MSIRPTGRSTAEARRGDGTTMRVVLLVAVFAVCVGVPCRAVAQASGGELLERLQRRGFDYFWMEANAETGLVPDRSSSDSFCSIAATGFGLTAVGVGIDRGYVSREEGRARVLRTLETLWQAPQGTAPAGTVGHRGFFYHFLDCTAATRFGTSELSTVDTALLLGGVLYAAEYFGGADADEEEIRALADSIYRRVDWPWAQARPPAISHGWSPEDGFIPYDWIGYNEAMIVYLLALGSPTHPVEPDGWTAWTSGYEWRSLYGYSFVVFPPLFGHQYTHLWFDFRGLQDAYMREKGIDYFENSRRATLAQRAYCIANPNGYPNYGPNEWGLTASDDPVEGYLAHGAPPGFNDNGTLTPTALGGSIVFAPEVVVAALQHLYDTYRFQLWGPYGFRDAFNARKGWFADDYLGIDQGPFVIMIENHRTGAVWQTFMRHDAVQRGLDRAGFEPIDTRLGAYQRQPGAPMLEAPFPNPTGTTATLRYTLRSVADVRLAVVDAQGRVVEVLVDGRRPAGRHRATFDGTGLAAGVYVARLQASGVTRSVRLIHVP